MVQGKIGGVCDRSAVVTLFVALLLYATPGWAEYVTRFGREILGKSNLIVEGFPVAKVPLNGGGTLVEFQVKRVYQGQIAVTQKVSLLYPTDVYLSPKERRVVFLQALTSHTAFRVLGEFSWQEQDGPRKQKSLERLLTLELIPDFGQKQQAYLMYCLEGLSGEDAWFRTHAFYELEHLTTTQKNLVNHELVTKLQAIYPNIPEPLLREQLKKQIVLLRRNLPASKTPPASSLTKPEVVLGEIQKARRKLVDPSSDLSQKSRAIELLSLFPCKDSQEAFVSALRDDTAHVRALAVFYLGVHQCREAIPEIMKVLRHDPALRVRKNAILALARLQAVEAVPEIRRYLQLPYTRWAAEEAMKKLVPEVTENTTTFK